jgi:hypothetical protein
VDGPGRGRGGLLRPRDARERAELRALGRVGGHGRRGVGSPRARHPPPQPPRDPGVGAAADAPGGGGVLTDHGPVPLVLQRRGPRPRRAPRDRAPPHRLARRDGRELRAAALGSGTGTPRAHDRRRLRLRRHLRGPPPPPRRGPRPDGAAADSGRGGPALRRPFAGARDPGAVRSAARPARRRPRVLGRRAHGRRDPHRPAAGPRVGGPGRTGGGARRVPRPPPRAPASAAIRPLSDARADTARPTARRSPSPTPSTRAAA